MIDFSGDVVRDGALDGRGTLVLPTGGAVTARFATDAAGHVRAGAWSADLEVGEHRLTISAGTLDDAGLHGRFDLAVVGQQVNFAFSLPRFGARVVVFTTSGRKRDDALRLGADVVVVSTDAAAMKQHAGSFDFILDTVSGEHDINAYLQLLRRDGTVALVGRPPSRSRSARFP